MELLNITLPFRILAVDPATTISAWSILEVVSLHPVKIHILACSNIDGMKLLTEKKQMKKLFSKQFCVVDALEDEYISIINEWKPTIVVSEGAYVGVHVSAAIAISLAIHSLRKASYRCLGVDIAVVPPAITKLAFTGKGGSDKDVMRSFYVAADYLIDKPTSEEASEHIIDSIAHGYGWLCRDVLGTVNQVSALEVKRARREKEKLKQEKMKI